MRGLGPLGLISIVTIAATFAAAEPVTLLSFAMVNGPAIRLSDLLPAAAPDSVRRSAETISLGRTPLAGATREFDREQLLRALAAHPEVSSRVSVPEHVLIRRSVWPIGRQQVLRAISAFLQTRGVRKALSDDDVRYPEGLTTGAANAAFEVEGSRRGSTANSVYFFLRPVDRSAGGRFLVEVSEFNGGRKPAGSGSVGGQPVPMGIGNHPLMRSGERAILVLQGGEMRISLPVICLGRGTLGESIRVLDRASHRVFVAQIAGEGTLRAGF
jgi:hypothetical protein